MANNKISAWLTLSKEACEYNRQCANYAAQLDRLVEAARIAITGIEAFAAVNPEFQSESLAAIHRILLAALRDIELESEDTNG